jgi:hypothetical protein
MRKFSEVLEYYLDQRESLNGDDYYDLPIHSRNAMREHLKDLADELDQIISKVQNAGS